MVSPEQCYIALITENHGAFLESVFPRRIIFQRPSRSPDFNPCYLFLCGHLKFVAYLTHPLRLAEVRQYI